MMGAVAEIGLARVGRADVGLEDQPERGWWHRVGTSAVLVGAGLGWTTLWVAAVVAAPLSLALGRHDDGAALDHRHDLYRHDL